MDNGWGSNPENGWFNKNVTKKGMFFSGFFIGLSIGFFMTILI
ncbi:MULTISPECIES: hypothetical protein [unclassified Pseudoalteromonas]|nr:MULTISPECIES: hypothetical protein [unclassified Pseudoalteromonas]